MMNCWRCGKIMLCSCSSCHKKSEPPDSFVERVSGDIIFCGYCGFGLHVDAWMDVEVENYTRNGTGAFKDKPYDYEHYVKLFERLNIPLSFSAKYPKPCGDL